jgi:hypothetical protein
MPTILPYVHDPAIIHVDVNICEGATRGQEESHPEIAHNLTAQRDRELREQAQQAMVPRQ